MRRRRKTIAQPNSQSLNVTTCPIALDARGVSPQNDARLLIQYLSIFRSVRPAALLAFTAKPNIYGSLAARLAGVPVINTITGLGTGFLSSAALELVMSLLYRSALKCSSRVFFHNVDDLELFETRRLIRGGQGEVVAGSGVDLQRFAATPPPISETPTFLFIGRFLTDKGALEFAEAAAAVRRHCRASFRMLGSLEDHPKAVLAEKIQAFADSGVIEIIPQTDDVRPVIAAADCLVLPSYREGLPRVVLEASAMGRPVIATDVPGCRQAVEQGVTGLLCEPRSAASLAHAMLQMVRMTPAQRAAMGAKGRVKAEREFSEEQVVSAYLAALELVVAAAGQ